MVLHNRLLSLILQLHYYRNREDVNAVVHTHAPYTTVFGITDEKSMPVVLNEDAMELGGPLPVAPYACPGTKKLAKVTLEATGEAFGVIMAHHGLITIGVNLKAAYGSTLATEDTARTIILARSMGANVNALD
jgi:ribulose-5-phosphate 4-epimerase/fuculose-1-phosphate aldolase